MILDRTQTPKIYPLSSLPGLTDATTMLDGGLKAYLVEGGTEDIVRVDVVFRGGTRYESKPMLAATCQALIKEGTANYSANKISETFDFYGAQFGADLTKDQAEVSLLCQGKHKSKLFDMFAEVLTSPQFPEEELALLKKRGKSALAINLEKVQFKCRLLFSALMFKGTPYQDHISTAAYDDISTSDLKNHFEAWYNLNDAYVVISGKNTAQAAQVLNKALDGKRIERAIQKEVPINWGFENREKFEKQEDAIQSAIRFGTEVVGREHEDFIPLYVANVALGGYFGSRLMQNIREEKGYTYGIGSGLNHMRYGSYLSIATEVGADVTEATQVEIVKELKRMCNEPLENEELTLIRNYVSGSLIQGFDGPFAMADRLKVLLSYGLEVDFFTKLSAGLYGVDANQIVEVSNKYLHPSLMTKAVVGKW